MPVHHDAELPALEISDLTRVTGGAGSDLSSMLPVMLLMRSRSREVAPAPAAAAQPAAWTPKVVVDGVEQKLTRAADGTLTSST